ncbi:Pkinase domain-containing protein/Lectin_legB domain-containing protein, partial [Cephalotus follicularis]
MTTTESLLVQIFEKKKWIVDQVKHQTDLFDQNLACKCLLAGVAPPPWLCPPQPVGLNGLSKEELILGLLLPRSQPTFPYSTTHSSLYRNPVVTIDNVESQDGLYDGVHVLKDGFDAGNGSSVLPQCSISDVACACSGIPEQDGSVTSPQECGLARNSDNLPEPAVSLARIQRSKSRQRALELRNSAKASKSRLRDENGVGDCASGFAGSGIAFLQSDHVDEKKSGSSSYYGIITRSRGSARPPTTLNEPLELGKISLFSEKLGDTLTESISRRTHQQHNHFSESLDLVNLSVVTNESCGVSKKKAGVKRSREMGRSDYSGRITRSRSSSQPPNNVKLFPKQDSFSNTAKDEGFAPTESFGKSALFPSPLSWTGEEGETDLQNAKGHQLSAVILSPSQKDSEVCTESAREHLGMFNSKERDVAESRGSQATCTSERMSKAVDTSISLHVVTRSKFAASSKSHNELFAKISEERSLPGEKDLELGMVSGSKHLDMGNFVDPTAITTRPETTCSAEGLLKPVISNTSGCGVTASKSTAFNKSPLAKSFNRFEGIDLQEVQGSQANFLPCCETESSDKLDLEIYDLVAAETDKDSAELIKAPVCSGSNRTSASLRAGLEDLVSSELPKITMFVKPRQLDFDDKEEYILNEASIRTVEEKKEGTLSEKGPFTLLQSGDILDKLTFVHYQEKGKSTMEILLPEEQEALSKDENPSTGSAEAHAEETDGASRTMILNAGSSVQVTTKVYEDAVTHSSQDRNKTSNQQFLVIDHSTNVQLTLDNSPEMPLKDPVGSNLSNLNADTMTEFPFENVIEDLDGVIPTNTVSEDINLDNDAYGGPKISAEADFSLEFFLLVLELFLYKYVFCWVHQGELSIEEKDRVASSPLTFNTEDLGAPFISSLAEQLTRDFYSYLGEEAEVSNSTSTIFDSTKHYAIEENQNLEVKLELGNTEQFTGSERSTQEKRSHLGEYGKLLCRAAGSPHRQSLALIGAEQTTPEFQGFVMQANDEPSVGKGINFEKLDLTKSSVERACVLEQLCKSACLNTPLSHFSNTHKLHKTPKLYQSVPNGLLECMDLRSNHPIDVAYHGGSHSDMLPFSSTQSAWDISKPYKSPVGKLWDRIKTNCGSSEKRGSFPELPCIREENENPDKVADAFQEGSGPEVTTCLMKREPLADITENPELHASCSEVEICAGRNSLDSVSTEFSFTGECNMVKPILGNSNSRNRKHTNKEENQNTLENGIKTVSELGCNRFSKPKLSGKNSLINKSPIFLGRDSKRNNIVSNSNITSFIPLVQQKQAAAIITGNRDVKVKSLAAAEAAKRLQEKRENERKKKKEDLIVKRARQVEENQRQLELKKIKKEEEQKKKEADMAVRKRQREEEKRNEMERKRKRVEDSRKQHQEHEEKLRLRKDEKEMKCRTMDERIHEKKDERGKDKNMEKEIGHVNLGKTSEIEPWTSTSDATKANVIFKDSEVSSGCGNLKVLNNKEEATENQNLLINTSLEQSYDISPYQSSDDEDEDDDIPNSKFVPSWSSKNRLAVVVSSQKSIEAEVILPSNSFCSIAEAKKLESFSSTMAMPQRKLLVFLFLSTLFTFQDSFLVLADDVTFNFSSFTLRNLTLLGDSYLRNGVIGLTRELGVPSSSSGTAIYDNPVPLFDKETNITVSFSTRFSFSIPNVNPSSFGDGLSFFLSPDNQILGSPGGYLGLVNSSQLTKNKFVAIEIDTKFDAHFEDPNENHIGLDIDSLNSIKTANPMSVGIDLKSGSLITSWIDYKHDLRVLKVFMSYTDVKPENPLLIVDVDLSGSLQEVMYVGFAASTEGSTELHLIQNWSFQTFGFHPVRPRSRPHNVSDSSVTGIPDFPISNSNNKHHNKVGLGLGIAGPAFFCVALAVFGYVSVRKWKGMRHDKKSLKAELVTGPKAFRYKELKLATRGFHSSRIIGHGAFGNVYKAFFVNSGTIAAVKRSRHLLEGKTEFLAELSIIACLRHKNLVQLQGWCAEGGELLLVYEFMPNGSLDKLLYQESDCPLLSWSHRQNIAVGLASVLSYLHHECEQQVIHRDIKTSNIMLDGNFNARLGDFGLARLMDHDKSPVSTLTAGTMGYLAPEYLQYGKATEMTDVFSFGVVILEVACGRRPIEREPGSQRMVNLVDWVWGLYAEGKIIEAADKRLNGEFREEEMKKLLLVGLSCANPDSAERPTMRRVLQILTDEVEPVAVPKNKPSLTFSCGFPLALEDIVSDGE